MTRYLGEIGKIICCFDVKYEEAERLYKAGIRVRYDRLKGYVPYHARRR